MKKRLLIVDDDRELLESLKLLLETSYDICLADNGPQAFIEIDRGFHPDAILLDLFMPVMDGTAFLGELKRRGEKTPVLIITASWDAAALAPELAGLEILRKPFTYEQLREKLDRVLRGVGGEHSGRIAS
jgi:DNA-binding response OmpR family regulator